MLPNYFMAVNKTVDYKVMNTLKNDEDVASLISDNWLGNGGIIKPLVTNRP